MTDLERVTAERDEAREVIRRVRNYTRDSLSIMNWSLAGQLTEYLDGCDRKPPPEERALHSLGDYFPKETSR